MVLIGVAVYFFLAAVSYMAASQAVVAGLLSAVIGFATLSAGTSLIRTFVITRASEVK